MVPGMSLQHRPLTYCGGVALCQGVVHSHLALGGREIAMDTVMCINQQCFIQQGNKVTPPLPNYEFGANRQN